MHIRQLRSHDISGVLELLLEITHLNVGPKPVRLSKLNTIITNAIEYPDLYPSFIHDGSGDLSGMLIGSLEECRYTDDLLFRETLFYIRPKYYTIPLARAYVLAAEDACRTLGVHVMYLGNELVRDRRIDTMYRFMGYDLVNTIHARRL